MRSEKDLAKEALAVQNASNLAGVVNTMKNTVHELWDIARERGEGTKWVNNHPVTRLYVDKLASLSGLQFDPEKGRNLDGAYTWAFNMEEKGEE